MPILFYIFEESLLEDLKSQFDISQVPSEMTLGSKKWYFICLSLGIEKIKHRLEEIYRIENPQTFYTWDKDTQSLSLQDSMYVKLIRELRLNAKSLKYLYVK